MAAASSPPETAGPSSPSYGWAWAVAGTSLLLNLWLASTVPVAEFLKYPVAAERIAAGTLDPERWADFSPLYLHLTLWLQSVTDPDLRLIGPQMILTAAALGLLFLVFERHFGRRWALVGALIALLDRHVLVYQRVLEPEALLLFFTCAFLHWVGDPAGRIRRPLAAGLVVALAVATRPTLLPLALIAAAWPWAGLWIWRDRNALEFSAAVKQTCLFLAPVALLWVASPDRPTMNPGTVFFEGNQPMSRGTSAVYPPLVFALGQSRDGSPDPAHAHYRALARTDAGPNLSVMEVNGLWSSRALAFLSDTPGSAWQRLQTKGLYTFHAFPWHDLPAAWAYDLRLATPFFPFGLLSALALAGMLLRARSWRQAWVFYGLAAGQIAVMWVFYVSPRQRLILVPALVFFALTTLRAGVHRLRGSGSTSQRLAPVAGSALAVGLAALSFSLPDAAMDDLSYRRAGAESARALLGPLGRDIQLGAPLAGQEDALAEAIAQAPWLLGGLQPAFLPRQGTSFERRIAQALEKRIPTLPAAHRPAGQFDLGILWLMAGDIPRATEVFRRLDEAGARFYRQGGSPESPALYLARIAAMEGRHEEARQWLTELLGRHAGNLWALAELAALDQGGGSDAEEALVRYAGAGNADYLIGSALLHQGRAADAVPRLRRVAEAFVDFREVRLALAAALARSGQEDAAMEALLEADRRRLEPVAFTDDMARLYDRAAFAAKTPEALFKAAQGLFHYGRPLRALRHLQRSEPLTRSNPAFPPLIQRLRQALGAPADTQPVADSGESPQSPAKIPAH